ncbi:SDR family NAD(P)-dependent oxidoreductase [Eubacterium ramulus]
MNIAIITGASSGLGREFALQICQNYASEIDEIWLLARRKEPLLALAQEISATGICIGAAMPMDITDEEQMKDFQDKLEIETPTVKYLVNAAGLAKIGGPFTLQPEELTHMIDLNCKAAVHMTAICMPHFDKGSRILQICSTAGFQPMQGLNVYAASKAFLLRYSQALRWELIGKQIYVTAVCPYWIKDTEFIGVAKDTDNPKAAHAVHHFPLASKTKSVVRLALLDNKLGLWVSTPGPVCFVHRLFCKIIPPVVAMGWWELIRRI